MAKQPKKRIEPYNPLDKKMLGVSVADAVLHQLVHPLGNFDEFVGAGIYAIYYTGNFGPYEEISKQNLADPFSAPIYVGRAIPPGSRKGFGLGEDPGPALYKRLKEHAESIEQVGNIDLADFHCRYLVVEDIWIPLGESLLIEQFRPIWNQLLDGFGNHTPGKGRFNQQRSPWDVVHVGRKWADKCAVNDKSEKQFLDEIANYIATSKVIRA